MIRFLKRRNPAARLRAKHDSLLQPGTTPTWRERLKDLKAAQEVEDNKPAPPRDEIPGATAE